MDALLEVGPVGVDSWQNNSNILSGEGRVGQDLSGPVDPVSNYVAEEPSVAKGEQGAKDCEPQVGAGKQQPGVSESGAEDQNHGHSWKTALQGSSLCARHCKSLQDGDGKVCVVAWLLGFLKKAKLADSILESRRLGLSSVCVVDAG